MLCQILTASGFQFTPLREGRRFPPIIHSFYHTFQFTPLREGRPNPTCLRQLYIISIHAPPRGATDSSPRQQFQNLFQFTPLREGRRHSSSPPSHGFHFNSRPSARGDQTFFFTPFTRISFQFTPLREGRPQKRSQPQRLGISIHAPPRGATPFAFQAIHGRQISIHAPPRGATAKDMQFLQIFCSTLTNQHGLTIVPRNLSRLFW